MYGSTTTAHLAAKLAAALAGSVFALPGAISHDDPGHGRMDMATAVQSRGVPADAPPPVTRPASLQRGTATDEAATADQAAQGAERLAAPVANSRCRAGDRCDALSADDKKLHLLVTLALWRALAP